MLMPIGRFARAARLSIKSLRNYDESGLLPAAFVDPDTGYRYYRLEQLARAGAMDEEEQQLIVLIHDLTHAGSNLT